tara:strand:- start:288 stop:1049 length:762 start_codon:yes stop_codon:yes gene_type:complete
MTLILDRTKKNNCASTVKKIIPAGSVINSYAFYDGKIEFSLANDERFISANTTSLPVYTFWRCLMYDPSRLHAMVSSDSLRFDGEAILATLQDMWHSHSSPIITASLFFIMNRCSSNGLVSSGELDLKQLAPTAIAKLKTFSVPDNFHLNLSPEHPIKQIKKSNSESYNLVLGGRFNYNLFEYGKSVAIEQTSINHKELIKLCKDKNIKILITYDYDQRVLSAFKNNRLIMVDKYGVETAHKERAEEIIVANF